MTVIFDILIPGSLEYCYLTIFGIGFGVLLVFEPYPLFFGYRF